MSTVHYMRHAGWHYIQNM